jgi:hypothetical protein
MKGSFFVSQFDLADAGLLGAWKWHGKQTGNNRDFPMDAVLKEEEDGTYTMDLDFQSSSITIDITIPGITLSKNCIQIPLGIYAGTYATKNATYQAFTLMEGGNGRAVYATAVNSGYFRIAIEKAEDGTWHGKALEDEYPEKYFRFEMWDNKSHEGTAKTGLVLKEIYMDKQ